MAHVVFYSVNFIFVSHLRDHVKEYVKTAWTLINAIFFLNILVLEISFHIFPINWPNSYIIVVNVYKCQMMQRRGDRSEDVFLAITF